MSTVIKAEYLGKTIEDIVGEYTDEVVKIVNEETEKTAKNAVKELKANSPKHTGEYAKGWKSKVVKERYGTSAVVYNGPKYQLTHLLEHGHAKRGGGRVDGRSHIADVEVKAVNDFFDNVLRRL